MCLRKIMHCLFHFVVELANMFHRLLLRVSTQKYVSFSQNLLNLQFTGVRNYEDVHVTRTDKQASIQFSENQELH